MKNTYTINGYEVKHTYAGIDQYTVSRDGKEIGTCWSIGDVAKMTKTDADTVKEEMWRQMWRQR